jgi:hypothetical protein
MQPAMLDGQPHCYYRLKAVDPLPADMLILDSNRAQLPLKVFLQVFESLAWLHLLQGRHCPDLLL